MRPPLAFLLCASLGTFGGHSSAAAAQDVASAAGTWSGTIAVPPGPGLAIMITLQRDSSGAWKGAIDIPAQGAKGVPLGDIAVDGPAVSFRLSGPGNPSVTARLSGDAARMSGTLTQGGATTAIELTRAPATLAVSIPARPQEPKRPFPYAEEEVTYRNEQAAIRLAGTLTRPSAGGPFPAVLLISGSGVQDRDSTILGHKPFLVIADHLTRAGFAVLRVDDRGAGGSDRGPLTATTRDFAGDAEAGVAYLKARRDIDPARVGLVGHSEGANVAAIVAAGRADLAFIVMLAGTGLPGDEILLLQAAGLARTQGAAPGAIAWDRTIRRQVYDLLKSEAGGTADDARRQALLATLPAPPGATDTTAARTLAAALLKSGSGAWFRHFLSDDPAPTLARVRSPVLVLIGDNDLQVPPEENLPAIRKALESGGNGDHTIIGLPGLNHLFQTSASGSPAEYATIEETFAPSALAIMTDWMLSRIGR